MNWGIRILVILIILGGLVWLNWDRFSEESKEMIGSELVSPSPEAVIDHTSGTRIIPEPKPDNKSEPVSELVDNGLIVEPSGSETASSKLPEFVLQASPASLNNSDAQARSAANEIYSGATDWLMPEEQLRKWTLLVTQAAEGKTLFTDRPFTFKLAELAVEERDERYFISTQNFERYSEVVNILTNMPAEKLVAYYRAWYPLLEKAFGELGLPGSFDERVDSMIARILAVEVLKPPIELKKPTSVTYKFLDPELEKASQIEKWLWRMGPENTRKIQSLASRIKQALEKS